MAPLHKVFGMGNPLLDISAEVTSAFLEKYKLAHGGFCFQGAEQDGYYEDLMRQPNCNFIAGGATLNTMRIFMGILMANSNPESVKDVGLYTGCIGSDEEGQKLKQLCDSAGLRTSFQISEGHPTGLCGVSIVDCERSLCTNLGAAERFEDKTLMQSGWKLVEEADIVYTAGFFLTVCPQGMIRVGEHCAERNKIFMTGLSATAIVEHFKTDMMQLLPYADIIFGNETEWAHFGDVHCYGTSNCKEIAKRAVLLPKRNRLRERMVVLTQGIEDTLVFQSLPDGSVKTTAYPVLPLLQSQIVDTNAAGDSFVGGFLAAVSLGQSLDVCVMMAHAAARHVIMRSGCTFQMEELPKFSSIASSVMCSAISLD